MILPKRGHLTDKNSDLMVEATGEVGPFLREIILGFFISLKKKAPPRQSPRPLNRCSCPSIGPFLAKSYFFLPFFICSDSAFKEAIKVSNFYLIFTQNPHWKRRHPPKHTLGHRHKHTQTYANLIFFKLNRLPFYCSFHSVRRSRAVSGTTLEFFVVLTLPWPLPPHRTPPPKMRGIIPASSGARDHTNQWEHK